MAQESYKSGIGPWRVEVIDETWKDASRADTSGAGREVPVRVYLPTEIISTAAPKAGAGPASGDQAVKHPVVVFSHGLGGTREGYEYIGRYLASQGYLVIHPQHAGSDQPAMVAAAREKLRGEEKKEESGKGEKKGHGKTATNSHVGMTLLEEGTSDPANLENRPKDITFVLDEVAKHPRLSKYADMTKVAAAGHSFGAYTTMAVSGMLVDLPGKQDQSFRDQRVLAGIAMSPQGAGVMGVDEKAWDPITIPMLIVTGTRDMGQGDRAATWRHEPYAKIKSAEKYFLNITDATHMTFADAGLRMKGALGDHEKHISYVKETCAAFLDAYLRDDGEAKKWLKEKVIVKVAGGKAELQVGK